MGTCRVYLDASDADVPPDGPQGKPPTGYKCKICESEEVRWDVWICRIRMCLTTFRVALHYGLPGAGEAERRICMQDL